MKTLFITQMKQQKSDSPPTIGLGPGFFFQVQLSSGNVATKMFTWLQIHNGCCHTFKFSSLSL